MHCKMPEFLEMSPLSRAEKKPWFPGDIMYPKCHHKC